MEETACMAKETGQESKDAGQDAPLYKAWLSNGLEHLSRVFGHRLADVLVAFAIMLLVFLAVSFVYGLIWYLMPIFSDNDKLSTADRKDLVQGFASVAQAAAVGLAGAVGLVGLFFTWRSLKQTQESTRETLELTEQGQITERFTRAIELLGASADGGEVIEARVGAVYALQEIARESDEYYLPSMEILAPYVRKNAVRKPGKAEEKHDLREFWAGHERADIQAIISVLGKRVGRYGEEEDDRILRHGTDLRNATFHDGNFTGLWLLHADLREASFAGSDFREAYFGYSDLRGAFFDNVENLTKASFIGANLKETRFHGVDLTKVEDLTPDQIKQAVGNEHTLLPNGLTKPKHWTANDTNSPGPSETETPTETPSWWRRMFGG
jgi:hypothetical protein